MGRHANFPEDYSMPEFQELLADLRFASLKTANLSTNVAVAFLTGIPHVSRKVTRILAPQPPVEPNSRAAGIPREGYLLDQDHVIEFEDDRLERHYVTVERAPPRRTESAVPDEPNNGDSTAVPLRTLLSRLRLRTSIIWGRYCDKRTETIKADSSHNTNTEEPPVRERRKFYISYAELIIPSQENYDPHFMTIPLQYGLMKSRSQGTSSPGSSERHEDDEASLVELAHLVEINTRFRAANEWLHPSLSLTKLSRIKLTLFLAPRSVAFLDPSTVFSAWILFERLVVKGAVTKHNRRLYAATCLILAYKFNQDGEQVVINEILAYLSRDKTISARAIFANEMTVFTLLEFSLKQSYGAMRLHVHNYLEFNRITFEDLYETADQLPSLFSRGHPALAYLVDELVGSVAVRVATPQPGVLQHRLRVCPLPGVLLEAHVAKVVELPARLLQPRVPVPLHPQAVPRVGLDAAEHRVHALLRGRAEGRVPEVQLEGQHPQRPDVALVVELAELPLAVVLAGALLRRPVVVGAAHVVNTASLPADVRREAKVREFAAVLVVEQDVLRLDVQVRDVLVVAGADRPRDFEQDFRDPLLRKAPARVQVRVQIAVEAVLEHDVHHGLRGEPRVYAVKSCPKPLSTSPRYVRMPQVAVELDFALEYHLLPAAAQACFGRRLLAST
ncbi:cyclin dependent kinase binding protein, putative [Babesia caballi]|uniref:Cyclin dependent kinase binding protein, putative n=1 Tax=Babesia caballi TaxID=5871 RepID=A0AAV4LXB8_BABCB|nr:cyclin dependent kinase binding protein, putative [Babesia caballi]